MAGPDAVPQGPPAAGCSQGSTAGPFSLLPSSSPPLTQTSELVSLADVAISSLLREGQRPAGDSSGQDSGCGYYDAGCHEG